MLWCQTPRFRLPWVARSLWFAIASDEGNKLSSVNRGTLTNPLVGIHAATGSLYSAFFNGVDPIPLF